MVKLFDDVWILVAVPLPSPFSLLPTTPPSTYSLLVLRKRALKPSIVLREEKPTRVDACNILIQVVGARNLSVRDGLKSVKSYVEVKFQGSIVQTISLSGAHPQYKSNLSLSFMPPHNDFSPLYMEQVRDLVYFTVFDEIFEDDKERGGYLEGEETRRREKVYLGSFSVPFSTLYSMGRVEGVFRLDTPLLNMGYAPSPSSIAAPLSLAMD
ncbi:hypothetical protein EON64_12895, partial [archaeon]